ncbi:hypothetical protein V8E36_006126 [Tilletia maclaganii]
MKMAKVDSHRSTAAHQTALLEKQLTRRSRDLPALQTRSASPYLGDDSGYDFEINASAILPEEGPPPAPRVPVLPDQGLDAFGEALRLHRRPNRPAPKMWTLEQGDDTDSEGGDDEDFVGLRQEEEVNHTVNEHQDWWPFASQMELYGLCLFDNPRHPMSVKTQQMSIAFAKNAILAKGTTFSKEVSGESGNIFSCTSLQVALVRDFSNPETRKEMVLYPRRGTFISTFQDAEHFRNLPADISGPCAVLEDGKPVFVTEGVLCKDNKQLIVDSWYVSDNDKIRGTGHLVRPADVSEQITIDFALEDVQQRIGSSAHALRQGATPLFSLPIIVQCDDLSGVRSKKWNIHYALSFQNAALSPAAMAKEANIHMFSVSSFATPLEMVTEFVKQLSNAYKQPFEVWDSLLRRMVRVRPYPLLVLADNVMAATLCSHVGTGQNSKPCRTCNWGGNREYKGSLEGIEALMQPGALRTSEETVAELGKQLNLAVDGTVTAYFDSQKLSGVKDSTLEEITDIMFETRKILGGKVPDHPDTPARRMSKKAITQEMRAQAQSYQRGTWFNTFLQDDTGWPFEIHTQTPVETLHTLWLGPVKYLAMATVDFVNVDVLRVRLEAVSTDGLNCGKEVPAKYLLDHVASLNGKEYKLLAQTMPAALPPLVQEELAPRRLLKAWSAMARLCKAVSAPHFARYEYEECVEEVENALLGVYQTIADIAPLSIPTRPKFHILSHLASNIRAFGPAVNFNTERFEAFNSPIREASIHSNRQAPSRDILARMQDQEMLRHIVTGGEWISQGRVKQAASRVRQFGSQDNLEQRLLLESWGLQAVKKRQLPDSPTSPTCALGHVTVHKGSSGGKLFQDAALREQLVEPIENIEHIGEEEFEAAVKVWTSARDEVMLGSYVLVEYEQGFADGTIGKIEAISKRKTGSALVELEILEDVDWSKEWSMERVVARGKFVIVPADRIIMQVNVVHDCIHHQCGVDRAGRQIRQERRVTETTAPTIHHETGAEEQYFLLNHHLLRFPPPLLAHTFPSHRHRNFSQREVADHVLRELTKAKQRKSSSKKNRRRAAAFQDDSDNPQTSDEGGNGDGGDAEVSSTEEDDESMEVD